MTGANARNVGTRKASAFCAGGATGQCNQLHLKFMRVRVAAAFSKDSLDSTMAGACCDSPFNYLAGEVNQPAAQLERESRTQYNCATDCHLVIPNPEAYRVTSNAAAFRRRGGLNTCQHIRT